MAQILQPPALLPSTFDGPSLFLDGSIAMGQAVDWQTELTAILNSYPITILNPRRAAWDASWPQEAEFAPFREQVTWELEGLERADQIVVYFDPATQAPITLLELGLFARTGKLLVCCPAGYWRRGNVAIVCERYGIPQIASLAELGVAVKRWAEGATT